MQRLFSDFNQNIKADLAETEIVDKKKAKKLKEVTEYSRKDYLSYANAQGGLTRKIKRYKETDPAFANSLEQQRQDVEDKRKAAKAIYESDKLKYNRTIGADYTIEIKLHEFPNSKREESRKPVTISKKKLLAMKNPAAFLLKEEKKRLQFELVEAAKESEELRNKFFNDVTPEDLKRLRVLEANAKGLTTLLKKAKSNLVNVISAESGRAIAGKLSKESEEEEEEDYSDFEEEEEEEEKEEEGSANAPIFYVPLAGYIDIL